jgi:hypothetical protein
LVPDVADQLLVALRFYKEEKMDFYQFVQWCFRDGDATFMTLIVLGMLCATVANIAYGLGPKETIINNGTLIKKENEDEEADV